MGTRGPVSDAYWLPLFAKCPWCFERGIISSTNMDVLRKPFMVMYCENVLDCGAEWNLRGRPIKRSKFCKEQEDILIGERQKTYTS